MNLKSPLAIVIILLLIVVGYRAIYVIDLHKQPPPQSKNSASLGSDTDELSQSRRKEEIKLIEADFATLTPQDAYAAFKVRNADRKSYVQHEYAHIFGEVLYKELGIPGVAICDNDFAFGCYHSFFGFALIENGLDIIHELEQGCIDAFGPKGLGCQHGIGHGVLAELGPEQIDVALEACDKLRWEGPTGGCFSGVFMEYNFNTMDNTEMRPLTDDNFFTPCNEINEKFAEGCYFESAQWWMYSQHNRKLDNGKLQSEAYELAARKCDEIAFEVYRAACHRGFGSTVAGTKAYTIAELKELCSISERPGGSLRCLEGAAWLLSWEPEYEETWMELCSDTTGRDREICLSSKELI